MAEQKIVTPLKEGVDGTGRKVFILVDANELREENGRWTVNNNLFLAGGIPFPPNRNNIAAWQLKEPDLDGPGGRDEWSKPEKGGADFCICLRGTMKFSFNTDAGEQEVTVEAGQALYYSLEVPHKTHTKEGGAAFIIRTSGAPRF